MEYKSRVTSEIKATLGQLPVEALDELAAYIELVRGRKEGVGDDAVCRALSRALEGYGYKVPPSVFQGQPGASGKCKVFSEFVEEIQSCCDLSANECSAVRIWLAKLVIDDLQKRDVPIGPRTIISSLPSIRSIFHSAYPGYNRAAICMLMRHVIRYTSASSITLR